MLRIEVLVILVQVNVALDSTGDTNRTTSPVHLDSEHAEAEIFTQKIFTKYGSNQALSFEGFEHLLISLGIGNLQIPDHDIYDHFAKGEFMQLHKDHDHTGLNLTEQDNTRNSLASWSENNKYHSDLGDNGRNRQKRAPPGGYSEAKYRTEIVRPKCMTAPEILEAFDIPTDRPITENNFLHLCPAIVYQIDKCMCKTKSSKERYLHTESYHDHDDKQSVYKKPLQFWKLPAKTWAMSILAVSIISLVGLVCVAIIPVIQKLFFNHLIQFLVALAIGSLTGDALLHLIPHSLAPHDSSSHTTHTDKSTSHNQAVYKGLVALVGVYFFFLAERGLKFVSSYREKKMDRGQDKSISDTLDSSDSKHSSTEANSGQGMSQYRRLSVNDTLTITSPEPDHVLSQASCDDHVTTEETTNFSKEEPVIVKKLSEPEYEPEKKSRGHGHSHEAPTSVSAIAWMVIMGDGLHNFCDGMAIGAAFASGITGGLSTSVAVFCHELPHELGDFAVLLRTGMSVKQALFYNLVSSVLCFLGMVIGLLTGNLESADSWIFGLAAGMFIYISLVDMLPEISSENSCCFLLLHCLGISCGVSIMLVIALYEDQISLGIGDDAL